LNVRILSDVPIVILDPRDGEFSVAIPDDFGCVRDGNVTSDLCALDDDDPKVRALGEIAYQLNQAVGNEGVDRFDRDRLYRAYVTAGLQAANDREHGTTPPPPEPPTLTIVRGA
jgi:hypothetical protein